MMITNAWMKRVPELTHYVYWERKEAFLFQEDTYLEWTVFAVEGGSFAYEVGDRKGTASIGDLVFCPPGLPFRRVVVAPLTFHFIRFRWLGQNGQSMKESALSDRSLPIGQIHIHQTDCLQRNFERMKHADTCERQAKMVLLRHSLLDMWLLFGEQCARERSSARSQHQKEDALMAIAIKRIREQAFEPFNLKELSKALGLTPTYFSKRFKAAYHTTPVQYLTSLRLDKAKTMLVETSFNLDRIAEACGYLNGYYLNRVFARHVGMPPIRYRNRHQV